MPHVCVTPFLQFFSNSRYLEKICYRCFFDSFHFFSNCLYPVSPFHGKRKSVKVYKQEGRNLSFVEVSSFKHGIFPISIIAYNTLILSYFHIIRVLFNKQRYEFFSKSQHAPFGYIPIQGCCSISKDTNFSANHNGKSYMKAEEWVLFNKQRYEFFSKSQQWSLEHQIKTGCCSISKDTNFSANHNTCILLLAFSQGVVQ